jgi:quinol monooxygenase YgiN
MDGMIVIAGWIDVDPAACDELIEASVPLQRSTRDDEQGCLAYVIAADPVVPGRIHIYEQWATAADLDAHFQHPNFHATGELLRSRPRLGGDTSKMLVGRSGPVRDADGQASATYWPDS